jgi:hypothetical protein
MSKSRFLLLTSALLLATVARAQLDIPVSDIDRAFPTLNNVTIQLGSTTRTARPTPLLIDDYLRDGMLWFCLDPLQTIYHSGSGLPWGSEIEYASTNPSSFDKWTPSAPGLTAARKQDLSDLFKAYNPWTASWYTAGALQIAIWEIVNEFSGNPYSLSAGQMRVSGGNSGIVTTAQLMLNSLSTASVENKGNTAHLSYLIDGSYSYYDHGVCETVLVQDLLGYNPPIPESGSFAIGAVALLLPAIYLRIRRRNAKASAVA